MADTTPTTLYRLVSVAGSIGAAIEAVHRDLEGAAMDVEIAAAMADIRASACIMNGAPYYSDSIADDVISDLIALDIPNVLELVDQLAAPGSSHTDEDVTYLLDAVGDVAIALTEGDAARIITALVDATDPVISGAADPIRNLLRDRTDLELDFFND